MKGSDLELIVYILATWRLAHLLAEEDGPFSVLDRLRGLVGVDYDDVGQPYGTNTLADGLLCVKCNSIWIGLVWAVLWYVNPDLTFWAALPFVLSGGAILVNGIVDRLERP